jgi:hypothetical protein
VDVSGIGEALAAAAPGAGGEGGNAGAPAPSVAFVAAGASAFVLRSSVAGLASGVASVPALAGV